MGLMTLGDAFGFAPVLVFSLATGPLSAEEPANYRKPGSEKEMRSWLENMVWYHRFAPGEIGAWRWGIALVVYAVLLGGHAPIFGVSPFPV